MGVIPARLVFLAFLGLTGTIIYNALYLQDEHRGAMGSAASVTAIHSRIVAAPAAAPVAKLPAVRTDLPPLKGQEVPEQLVRAVQRELKERGYDTGPADGKLREDTRAAIASYEKAEGLPVTGVPTDELLREILLGVSAKGAGATGSLKPASSESSPPTVSDDTATIKAVQQIMSDLGYSPGPVDGTLGASTSHAIAAFQRDRKMAQDGRITPELLREIKRVTGRDLEASAARP